MSLPVELAQPVPHTAALVLAQSQNDPGGQGEDFGKSSPVALVVLILFFVAVAFLVRSMTKHLKRLPATFDTAAEPGSAAGAAKADVATTAPAAKPAAGSAKSAGKATRGGKSGKGKP
ncbi:hypothetical protein [Goodfellowiella coeruleoviolacea]|uniref:hypothetical protein n=1 Tax=Goodfellowiella coeruleoviolacea TaxID=334858 RepID=UPI003898F08A